MKAGEQSGEESTSEGGRRTGDRSERWAAQESSTGDLGSPKVLSTKDLGSKCCSGIKPGWVREFYEKAEAAQCGLTSEEFAGILREIGAKYLSAAAVPQLLISLGSDGQPAEQEEPSQEALTFYAGLRLEELA